MQESSVNPAGDGGPTSTAATSKNPGDLDSAIDRALQLKMEKLYTVSKNKTGS